MIGMKHVDGKWFIVFIEEYKIGQQTTLPKLELPVMVLHGCPKCRSVVRVYFKTDRFIPAWRYEGVRDEKDWKMKAIAVPGGMGIIDSKHVVDRKCYVSDRYTYQTDVYPFFDVGANLEKVSGFGDRMKWGLIGKIDRDIIPIAKKTKILFGPDFMGREAPIFYFDSQEFEGDSYRYEEEKKKYDELAREILSVVK
ncbi:MAG: hypothetical protein EH225_10560 [Calditrichaeota bacterium]|nr:MAG: hypothetical protein EH225_10560 [Calditrichota bacterium]